MSAARYERARDDLPWGWWLRATARGLEDGEGGVWPNVRAAFWEGRLGMRSGHLAPEQQELMLSAMSAIEARWLPPGEGRHDIFGGDMLFWRFHMCWLGSIGMTEVGHGSALEAGLSDEGRAVLLMLRATREPTWIDLPMQELCDAVARAERDAADDAREEALRSFERALTPLRHVFARERVGRSHVVTLTSIDPRDRMPMRRVAWSASFLDDRVRDDLFGWLAQRVHAWDDWGEIARSKGAAALTTHLLTLLVVSPVGAPVGRSDMSDSVS